MTVRLSEQQIRRINANRQRTLQNNQRKTAAVVIAHLGYQIVIDDNGEFLVADWRKQLDSVAVNDRVVIQRDSENHAIIESIYPREKTLYKQQGRMIRPMASHLDQLLVVIALKPDWQPFLVDRYIIAAHEADIPVAIMCNKIDLADCHTRAQLHKQLEIYAQLNYPIFYTSVIEKTGMDAITDWLSHKDTLICGQSGVGKSSLIQALLPDVEVWIQSLSTATGHGRHTTTNLRRYPFGDGAIIDSPGARGLALRYLSSTDILAGFPDIQAQAVLCRFNDCTHQHEPDCAVQIAVANGSIQRTRFNSFQQLLSELDTK